MIANQKDLWAKRAKKYNNLYWVHKKDIISKFIEICEFLDSDVVLDLGTGTGKIACTISPLVKEVHGLDISEEMISYIDKEKYKNLILKIGDAKNLDYKDQFFDKLTARLVFHHIINDDDLEKSIKECYRVLKPGGKIIISEGVPPHPDLKKDFEEIFRLKEIRRIFLPEDIRDMLKRGDFNDIRIHTEVDKGMSVKNWLDNDGTLSEETKKKLFDLHKFASPFFKKAYNLREKGDDILIDAKVAIVTGIK